MQLGRNGFSNEIRNCASCFWKKHDFEDGVWKGCRRMLSLGDSFFCSRSAGASVFRKSRKSILRSFGGGFAIVGGHLGGDYRGGGRDMQI